MGKTSDKSNNPRNKRNVNPKSILNNPAMEYSGRETDLRNIRDTGHSPGSPESESREGMAGNHTMPDDEKDRNRAGNVRNQSDEMQNAQDNVNYSRKSHVTKRGGKEGKTMVKNVELNEYQGHPENFEGQQEGGNHGGGNAANKKFGNQMQKNSTIVQQRDQDGDFKGRKNKK